MGVDQRSPRGGPPARVCQPVLPERMLPSTPTNGRRSSGLGGLAEEGGGTGGGVSWSPNLVEFRAGRGIRWQRRADPAGPDQLMGQAFVSNAARPVVRPGATPGGSCPGDGAGTARPGSPTWCARSGASPRCGRSPGLGSHHSRVPRSGSRGPPRQRADGRSPSGPDEPRSTHRRPWSPPPPQGVGHERAGTGNRDGAHPGDLAGLALLGVSPAQSLVIDEHDDLGVGTPGTVGPLRLGLRPGAGPSSGALTADPRHHGPALGRRRPRPPRPPRPGAPARAGRRRRTPRSARALEAGGLEQGFSARRQGGVELGPGLGRGVQAQVPGAVGAGPRGQTSLATAAAGGLRRKGRPRRHRRWPRPGGSTGSPRPGLRRFGGRRARRLEASSAPSAVPGVVPEVLAIHSAGDRSPPCCQERDSSTRAPRRHLAPAAMRSMVSSSDHRPVTSGRRIDAGSRASDSSRSDWRRLTGLKESSQRCCVRQTVEGR